MIDSDSATISLFCHFFCHFLGPTVEVDSPLGKQWAKTASLDLFAREPGQRFVSMARTWPVEISSINTWEFQYMDQFGHN